MVILYIGHYSLKVTVINLKTVEFFGKVKLYINLRCCGLRGGIPAMILIDVDLWNEVKKEYDLFESLIEINYQFTVNFIHPTPISR